MTRVDLETLLVKATRPKMSTRYEGEVELVCVCKLQFNLFAVFEVCFENKCLLLQTGETNE